MDRSKILSDIKHMKKAILIGLAVLFTGCAGLKEGKPFTAYPTVKIHRLNPHLRKCAERVNLEEIGKRLARKTGRKFKRPYFTYAVKIKGTYYLRYFFPLVHQRKFAGAEVWINCKNPRKIYYKFLPLE